VLAPLLIILFNILLLLGVEVEVAMVLGVAEREVIELLVV
jgi:hypothetical protein